MNAPHNPLQLMPQWADINNVLDRVLEADEFFVFVNTDGNCDYKTTDAYDAKGHKDPGKHGRMMSEATEIEHLPHEFLSQANKIAFKKLIGEGIARSFEHEYTAAKAAFQSARNYLERRQNRESRHWYLSAAAAVTAVLGVPFLVYIIYNADKVLTPMAQYIAFIEYGFLGALFSVMWRMGKTSFDFGAERKHHYWEASVRIIGGGIAALLIVLAVKAKLLLANFVNADNEVYALSFLCVAAGALEKWIPSLIGSVSKQKIQFTSDSKE